MKAHASLCEIDFDDICLSSFKFLSSSLTKIYSIAPSNARITITTTLILTKLDMKYPLVNLARDPMATVASMAVNLARDPMDLASITSAIPPVLMKLNILVIGKAAMSMEDILLTTTTLSMVPRDPRVAIIVAATSAITVASLGRDRRTGTEDRRTDITRLFARSQRTLVRRNHTLHQNPSLLLSHPPLSQFL